MILRSSEGHKIKCKNLLPVSQSYSLQVTTSKNFLSTLSDLLRAQHFYYTHTYTQIHLLHKLDYILYITLCLTLSLNNKL